MLMKSKIISFMFSYCLSLSNIEPLQNWNVSNGKNFGCMFKKCSSLKDIKPLKIGMFLKVTILVLCSLNVHL